MALLSIGEILDLGNSANMSSYIPYSALDYNPTGAISGISGSAIAGGVESSVVSSIVSSMVSGKADKSALENCCSSMSGVVSSIQHDVSSISSYVSGLTGEYLEKSASSMFAPSGNYMSASESSSFYPMTGNPSSFLRDVDLSNYATTAYVDSSVSGKLDASASSQFALSGDYAYNSAVSSKLDASASSQFVVDSSLSSYVAYSAISGENSHITSISGSAIGNALATLPLYVDSANMSAAVDELSSKVTIGVKTDVFALSSDLTNYQPVSGMTSYTFDSSFTAYTASVIPVVVVANSADATGNNVLYVVTGGL